MSEGEEQVRVDDDQQSIQERLQAGTHRSVFRDKSLVEPDTIIDENRIVGRDDQLDDIITYLRPSIQGDRPPNMLLYGPSGTGKSLIINAVCEQIVEISNSNGQRFGVVEINCQTIKSHDRAVYKLVETAADSIGVEPGVPRKGVSTDEKLDRLYELINDYFDSVIIILDEIDLLHGRRRGTDDEPAYSRLLYQLSRAEKLGKIEGCVSVAALTNDPGFMEDLDGRAESSFNPQDVAFPDYDANQLRAILRRRRDAFREDALKEDVIPLIAAFAAQSHGDARKAIDLFRKAGEIANRNDDDVVTEPHARKAQEEFEKDRTLTQIEGLSTQKKLSLYATACVQVYANEDIDSVPGTVGFSVYEYLTDLLDTDEKSRDTYLRYMNELDTYGMVTSERRSRGFGRGVHKEYTFTDDPEVVAETLREDSRLSDLEQDEDLVRSVVNAQVNDFLSR